MTRDEQLAALRDRLAALSTDLKTADENRLAAQTALSSLAVSLVDASVVQAQIDELLHTPIDPPPLPPVWTPPQPDGTAVYMADYAVDRGAWNGLDLDPGCTLAFVKLADGPAAKCSTPPGGHRVELSGFGQTQSYRRMGPGIERYLGQSILWPASFPKTQLGFHINMQLHSLKRATFGGKQSAVHLSAMDDTLKLRGNPNIAQIPGPVWTEPLRREVWLHVVQRFFIATGTTGRWQAWVRWDDEHEYRQVIPLLPLDILVDDTDWAYWKSGIYRSSVNRDPVDVLHRLALSGSTFAAVQR